MNKSEEQTVFIGPYLLSPTSSEITIVWGMNTFAELKVGYDDGKIKHEIIPVCNKYELCDDSQQKLYLYTVRLKKLRSATKYSYIIQSSNCILCEANFKTLVQKPNNIHIITLSDSHLFNISQKFSNMVKDENPDFILHSGDISFGTGYQPEQYINNWFKKIPKLLTTMPVYYIPGNHDDGPFFQHFFTEPQRENLQMGVDGRVFSFEYGNVHFTMVDSNPWGLFEMNAVNSGIQADVSIKRIIADILKWIKDDVSSPAACKAKWRIIILHHPYTDEFSNRYLVPIAEKYGVDLVISGHLHYYVKSISINYRIASKTVYICQGSAQDPESYLEEHNDERILNDFPEVVAKGKNNYGVLDVNKDRLCYKLYGFTENGEKKLVDMIELTHNKCELEISQIVINNADDNNLVRVQALVKNISDNLANVELRMWDNDKEHVIIMFGERNNDRMIVLRNGEECRVVFYYKVMTEGEHKLRICDKKKLVIIPKTKQLTFEHMNISLGKGQKSNRLTARIEIKNNSIRKLSMSIPFCINEQVVESQKVTLEGYEQKYAEFYYKFRRGGKYLIRIANQPAKEVYIERGICIIPQIQDKSGHGHYALLHGHPKIVVNGENTEVHFEDNGDYIEIPASMKFCAEQGFTGMVWAKVDRLAQANEMGHNPLMVRGKSVGWGATYFMRMVIERKGGLKWGMCHDITEYSWQGGNVDIGKWTQYTMTFDKKTGGASYCNGKIVAHVPGIREDDKIRQWANEPIFIGYSYIGHIIKEINRPKYFTHLPGSISQVRFYTTALGSVENSIIHANPQKIGPQKDELAVWLDFKNIISTGKHVTEWKHPIIWHHEFKSQKDFWKIKYLRTKTELPMHTTIKAVIELSDDGMTIKKSYTFILENGDECIKIKESLPAQYFRIKSEFVAKVDEEGIFIPKLQEYQAVFYNDNNIARIFWSTREDWEKGTFSGAVGFEPVDRLRNFPEYTDVIHG
ncbi:metallophosphoesterase [Pectinatus frisingensis]|uniref:metallophosphoesterase n=1 Tax=Pectinatus frisingensis TaxID=865 RepID=UPI0018C59B74|nr:metallophosphoesterase [Pectinatus frisingensis]